MNLSSGALRILVIMSLLVGIGIAGNHAAAAPGPSEPDPTLKPFNPGPIQRPSKPSFISGGIVEKIPGPFSDLGYDCLVIDWVRKVWDYPCPPKTMGNAITVDQDGMIYVAGAIVYAWGRGQWDSGEAEGPCLYTGSSDYLVLKYDTDGKLLWSRTYNGPGNLNDIAYAIAVDGAGNVYVTGTSWYGTEREYDYATVKYDWQGNFQWVQPYNGPASGDDKALYIGLDDDGSVYVTGWSEERPLGVSAQGEMLAADIYTVKYLPSGRPAWDEAYTVAPHCSRCSTRAWVGGIAVEGDGRVWVTGSFTEHDERGYEVQDQTVTINYDPAGQRVWHDVYGGPQGVHASAKAIAVKNGNAYITGNFSSEGHDWDETDYLTFKYDASGNIAAGWPQTYDGSGLHDSAQEIALDDNENVYVTGKSRGVSTGYDYATLKYSSGGMRLWTKRYDEGLQEEAWALALDSSGDVFVTGRSQDPVDLTYDCVTIRYPASGGECVSRYNGLYGHWSYSTAIAVDSMGDAYVTGYSNPSGHGFGLTPPRNYDPRITTIKYEKDRPRGFKLIKGDEGWLP